MSIGAKTVNFSISLIGNVTGEKWVGEFTTKLRLSHRDQLARDRISRELLGDTRPDFASPRAINQANIFSDLRVRLTQAPAWWKESAEGLDLEDDNVVAEVYNKALKFENDELLKLKENAEKAEKELKEEPPKV